MTQEVTQPVLKASIYEEVEKQVNKTIWDAVYKDIAEILKVSKKQLDNASSSALDDAISKNRVFMRLNKDSVTFSGKFNSKITKELQGLGAKYNKKSKTWNLGKAKVDSNTFMVSAQINQKNIRTQEKIIDSLQITNIQKAIEGNDLYESYDDVTKELEGDWKKASKNLAVNPNFTDEQRENIAREYTNNMDKYVTEFSEKQIVDLRVLMEQNVSGGARSDSMIGILQEQYGISKRKATFLAKQETRLLSTQYYDERSGAAGATKFRWLTSGDNTVRHEHKKLNRKIFTKDSLPIINARTGERGLPGQAFGCRCRAAYIF